MDRMMEGDKGYRIYFEDRGDYLFVRIEGEFDSVTISNSYWREIGEKCEELKPRRLFVEEDLRQQVDSVADIYQVASEIFHRSLFGIKIAFFDTQPDHHQKNIFAELVARNMGLNVRIFDNKDAAMDWLMSEQ
ncbi:MAG: hypothetical protein AB1477_03305 [Acidobacteriota bacterium]|jgi:hypothetical protein